MKTDKQQQAKDLYFQTAATKTEIAEKVGVTRKTILFWARQGNWDKVRMSARTMPALVAEKCYYLIDQYTSSLLVEGRATTYSTLQLRHAQTIHLLASTIKKLKNRSTVNESMEMFNFFLDGVNRRDPQLAGQIAPMMEEYITIRKNVETTDSLMEEFRQDATLPYPDEELPEMWADNKDNADLAAEFEEFLKIRESTKTTQLDTSVTMPDHENVFPDDIDDGKFDTEASNSLQTTPFTYEADARLPYENDFE